MPWVSDTCYIMLSFMFEAIGDNPGEPRRRFWAPANH